MIKNIKLVLQYDGTRYDGWQKQGNTDNTIQGKLEGVLERMCGHPVEVHGSGRTDAGVHALAQTANVKLEDDKSAEEVRDYLNHYLPEDIGIISASEVSERFHSRLNAKSKTYLYQIEMSEKRNVFERKYVYGLGKALNVGKMEEASCHFIGTHDFKCFCSNHKMKKSTVRTIESIEIRQNGTKLLLRFTADGFLYNMVRILTGTLIEVGLGQRTLSSAAELLEAGDRKEAGFTAPPQGLFLESVQY